MLYRRRVEGSSGFFLILGTWASGLEVSGVRGLGNVRKFGALGFGLQHGEGSFSKQVNTALFGLGAQGSGRHELQAQQVQSLLRLPESKKIPRS